MKRLVSFFAGLLIPILLLCVWYFCLIVSMMGPPGHDLSMSYFMVYLFPAIALTIGLLAILIRKYNRSFSNGLIVSLIFYLIVAIYWTNYFIKDEIGARRYRRNYELRKQKIEKIYENKRIIIEKFFQAAKTINYNQASLYWYYNEKDKYIDEPYAGFFEKSYQKFQDNLKLIIEMVGKINNLSFSRSGLIISNVTGQKALPPSLNKDKVKEISIVKMIADPNLGYDLLRYPNLWHQDAAYYVDYFATFKEPGDILMRFYLTRKDKTYDLYIYRIDLVLQNRYYDILFEGNNEKFEVERY